MVQIRRIDEKKKLKIKQDLIAFGGNDVPGNMPLGYRHKV